MTVEIFARDVKVGMSVMVADERHELSLARVTRVSSPPDTRLGMYAPKTLTGTIVVNGVVASCCTNGYGGVKQTSGAPHLGHDRAGSNQVVFPKRGAARVVGMSNTNDND